MLLSLTNFDEIIESTDTVIFKILEHVGYFNSGNRGALKKAEIKGIIQKFSFLKPWLDLPEVRVILCEISTRLHASDRDSRRVARGKDINYYIITMN